MAKSILNRDTSVVNPASGVTEIPTLDTARPFSPSINIDLKEFSPTAVTAQGVPSALELTSSNDVQDAGSSRLKLFSCSLSFFCAGVDGGSLGTLIPYFSRYYDVSLGSVAIV